MQNVIGPGFPHARLLTRIGRVLSIGLVVVSSAVVGGTAETHSPAPAQVELNLPPDSIMLANPLKRPKPKVPHITYHRKDYYYC